MPDLQPRSNEEVLQALGLKVKETGVDSFMIRIERKIQMGTTEQLTYCEEAELSHLIKPEDWLPLLFGGGTFLLNCYHVSDRTLPIGRMNFTFKGASIVSYTALDSPQWVGPKRISRPVSEQTQTFAEVEPRPANAPWRRSEGTQFPQPVATSDVGLKLLEQMRTDMATRDRQMAEARAQDREMFSRMIDKIGQPQRPALSAETIAALATPVMGLIGTWMQSAQAARLDQAKLMAEQQKETREILKAMTAPRSVDPITEKVLADNRKLMEKLSESSGGPDPTETVNQMMNTMSQMVGFTTKAINAFAEQRLGGDGGGGMLPAFREMIGAVESIVVARAGAQAAARGPQPQAPRPRQAQAAAQSPVAPAQLPQAQPQPQQAAPVEVQKSTVDQIIDAIVAHHPAKELASAIVGALKRDDPNLAEELNRVDGDLPALAEQKLSALRDENGKAWVLNGNNLAYVRGLMKEVEAQGAAAGVFGGGEEETEEPEDATPEGATQPVAPASPVEVVKFDGVRPSA